MTNRGPHSVSIWLVRRNSFYFSYYSKYMNLLHNHFLQIYVLFLYTYGKTNESEKMRHIYKRFFSKIEELRNYVKKKNGQFFFIDIIYKIALCNRSFIHYNKATHKLCFLAKSTESYRVGSHKIERIM